MSRRSFFGACVAFLAGLVGLKASPKRTTKDFAEHIRWKLAADPELAAAVANERTLAIREQVAFISGNMDLLAGLSVRTRA